MYAFELNLQYRRAVRERDLDTVLSLFTNDAIILSLLRGRCDPETYHRWLFENVRKATANVTNMFQALNGDISISVHSDYKWILNNDETVEFGNVSILDFTPDRNKIRKISYFYDAALVRSVLLEANVNL